MFTFEYVCECADNMKVKSNTPVSWPTHLLYGGGEGPVGPKGNW